ncbi:hypothetical protein ORS3428_11485 [Mesorhizobium sp. ORS 3428]|nr:hypothetical protein ORS3428_11485 [Mesorhizobium sp. ORS 3428]
MSEPRIDAERFLGPLDAFVRIGATPKGGGNRQALSPEDRRARGLLAELGRARGFGIGQDAIANLFIRREGKDNSRPPFLIGSHLDSQLTGGRFDGALGTLAAFEVLEALEDASVERQHFHTCRGVSEFRHAYNVWGGRWRPVLDAADTVFAPARRPEAIRHDLGLCERVADRVDIVRAAKRRS